MKITESAAKSILEIMSNNGLDTDKFFLRFETLENGSLGFTFSKDAGSDVLKKFHGLCVLNSHIASNITVDFGAFNGKQGIMFLENKNVN